jgi:hypothetical protein
MMLFALCSPRLSELAEVHIAHGRRRRHAGRAGGPETSRRPRDCLARWWYAVDAVSASTHRPSAQSGHARSLDVVVGDRKAIDEDQIRDRTRGVTTPQNCVGTFISALNDRVRPT